MESYHIDLETLLRALLRKSGELVALLKNIPGTNEQGRVRIILDRGKVVLCSIEGQNGYLVFGENALRLLLTIGELDWTYTPSVPQPPSLSATPQVSAPSTRQVPESPVIALTAYPIRLRAIGPQELASWSRLQRSVYSIVDGRKTVADIARVLSYHETRVIEALSVLRTNKIIAVSS